MLERPEEVREYLADKGWIAPEQWVHITGLQGGVSNQVWKIEGPDIRWVMKQALSKLRVKTDWYSDVRRIEREQEAMKAWESCLNEGEVPKIIHADREANTYIMTCAPDQAISWKEQMMDGRFDERTASLAGNLLGRMHRISLLFDESVSSRFHDLTFFEQLRIDPFHRFLIPKYPELETSIQELILQLTEHAVCLVHGDFSPKNLLVSPDNRIILLDYEVAHWGNPVFDVSFCLAHLMLKGLALRKQIESEALIRSFLTAYRDVYGSVGEACLAHTGLMLLARVDGKSTVEYLREEAVKEQARSIGIDWVQRFGEREELPLKQMLDEMKQGWKG